MHFIHIFTRNIAFNFVLLLNTWPVSKRDENRTWPRCIYYISLLWLANDFFFFEGVCNIIGPFVMVEFLLGLSFLFADFSFVGVDSVFRTERSKLNWMFLRGLCLFTKLSVTQPYAIPIIVPSHPSGSRARPPNFLHTRIIIIIIIIYN